MYILYVYQNNMMRTLLLTLFLTNYIFCTVLKYDSQTLGVPIIE